MVLANGLILKTPGRTSTSCSQIAINETSHKRPPLISNHLSLTSRVVTYGRFHCILEKCVRQIFCLFCLRRGRREGGGGREEGEKGGERREERRNFTQVQEPLNCLSEPPTHPEDDIHWFVRLELRLQ